MNAPLRIAPKPWTLDQVERRLKGSSELVLDVETEGLDWKVDKICGWVFTFGPAPADTTYLPVRHKGNEGRGNLDPKKVSSCIATTLRKKSTPTHAVGHSFGFDLKFMTMDGVDMDLFTTVEDTQIDAFLIDEHQRSFSLDACATYMKATAKKGDELYVHLARLFGGDPNRKQMGNYHRLAADDFLGVDYAIGDGESTWDLWKRQQSEIDGMGLRPIWDIECRCIRALARMEMLGVRVDEEQLHYVKQLLERRLEKLAAKFPKGFKSNAPSHMKELFTKAGITNWPMTAPSKTFPAGQPSYSKEWLNTTPLGREVVAQREIKHALDSFIVPIIERHLHKGRIHTTFNQTRGEEFGTVTGRLSSSNPNMQQIHKRNIVLGPVIRSMYIPDDGLMMTAGDYNQCEPRLLAHFAEVELLIKGYMSDPPIDAHSMVAKGAGIDRQAGKTLNQALLTGAGDAKAALMLGRPMKEAMNIVEAYFKSMPEIKPFQRKVINKFRKDGYLTSLLGRRIRLDDTRFAYRGPNRILQTGNADIIKNSVARIHEMLEANTKTTRMLLNIHDDILYQHPEKDTKWLKKSIEIMEDYGPDASKSVDLDVPMIVDTKTGANWSEASYDKETIKKAFIEMGGKYK